MPVRATGWTVLQYSSVGGGLKASVARANFGSRASNPTTRGWPLGPSKHARVTSRVTSGLKSDGKTHVNATPMSVAARQWGAI
jgi:hypothetical protein